MQISNIPALAALTLPGPRVGISVSNESTANRSQAAKTGSGATQTFVDLQSSAPATTLADTARSKINADYAKAKASGERIVFDVANGGRFPDFSSLSDSELAAVAKGGPFSKDESLVAKAELSGRMDKLLAPFSSSPRAVSMAIKAIYPALGADVREALGWTEGMLKTGDAIIRNFGPPENELETGSIFDKLLKFQATPGVLKFDQSLIERRGVSINLTA